MSPSSPLSRGGKRDKLLKRIIDGTRTTSLRQAIAQLIATPLSPRAARTDSQTDDAQRSSRVGLSGWFM